MRPSDEIHNYPRLLEQILERIATASICEENKKAILRFHTHITALSLSLARQTKHLSPILLIGKRLGKDFRELSRDDIEEFIKSIEISDYTTWTKHDYKVIFKIFYRWLKNSRTYPDEVAWIRCKTGGKDILPEDLLSVDDIAKLVQATNTLRDRVLVLVLFDSGCRIGEILSLRMRSVTFDDLGAQLIVRGKTGSRRVRIIASSPELLTWINSHPMRGDPDAPLWISLGRTGGGGMLSYRAAYSTIRRLAKKAGLRKRIYPHLFRHSHATMLARQGVNEAILNEHHGWVQGSKSAAGYMHVAGRDTDKELARLQGLRVEENGTNVEFKIRKCTRCGKMSSPVSKLCSSCGLAFDAPNAERIDKLRQKADKLISVLMQDEHMLDKLLNKIDELRSS